MSKYVLTDEQFDAINDDVTVKTRVGDVVLPFKTIRHVIKRMTDVLPAKTLIERKLCDDGKEYRSWSLFFAVQIKMVNKGATKYDFVLFQKVASMVWGMIGDAKQKEWKAQAAIVNSGVRTTPKVTANRSDKRKTQWQCMVCLEILDQAKARLQSVHAPNYEDNTPLSQKHLQFVNESKQAIALDHKKQLPKEWNAEFMKFYIELEKPEEERDQVINEVIKECRRLIGDAMKGSNPTGEIYFQIKVNADGLFECSRVEIPSIVHYAGKKRTNCYHRYFQDGFRIAGRVSDEHKLAFANDEEIYFWTALDGIPTNVYDAFEHFMIMALHHLDFGKKRIWNLARGNISTNSPFREIHPKLRVKIGLVLIHDAYVKLQRAIADASLLNSIKLLESYPVGPKLDSYIQRCRKEDRILNNGSGYAKKRPLADPTTESISTSDDMAQQFELLTQRLELLTVRQTETIGFLLDLLDQLREFSPDRTYDKDELANLITNTLDRLNLHSLSSCC